MLSPGGRGRAARTAIPRGMMEDLTGWHEGDEPESNIVPGEHFYKGLASSIGQQVSSPRTMISPESESDILIVPTPWILLKTQDQN